MLIASVIIKSNPRILQFLHKMFNVSALLLDEELWKCVVKKTPFSNCCFKTLT